MNRRAYRIRWDYIVMLFAFMNCFMVPIEVTVELEFYEEFWYKSLNSVIDGLFIVDILVNFNTSYEEGYDVITDRKVIAKRYFKSRFFIDFISAVPID